MPYPRARTPFRVPDQLAAVAALVLLITAWTGDGAAGAENSEAAGPAEIVVMTTSEDGPEDISESRIDARSVARFSLMLFRFN